MFYLGFLPGKSSALSRCCSFVTSLALGPKVHQAPHVSVLLFVTEASSVQHRGPPVIQPGLGLHMAQPPLLPELPQLSVIHHSGVYVCFPTLPRYN